MQMHTNAMLMHTNANSRALQHVAINFKLPNIAVLRILQSSIKIIYIKHRYNLFNQHLAEFYMTKTAVS